MSEQDKDIELIRQYLNGELSPTEMNSLEARALDDPFLQDALDGFTEIEVKNTDLNDLDAQLTERIKGNGKILSLKWGIKQWAIVASIIFCITIAGIYFNQIPNDKNIKLADLQNSKQIPEAEKIRIDSSENLNKYPQLDSSKNEQQIAFLSDSKNYQKTKILIPEVDIILEPNQTTADSIKSVALDNVAVLGNSLQYEKSIVSDAASINNENLMAARSMKSIGSVQIRNIKGKVVDDKDDSAIPGVSVKDITTGIVSQTDAKGEFYITATKNTNLEASYIGYDTQEITTVNIDNDSLKIALKQNESSLSEVVVVGYETQKKSSPIIAGPKNSWANFRKYLDNGAKLSNNKHGEVQLKFVIQTDGKLTDFKILKSFNAVADEKAVNLVLDYPGGWNGSTDKIPQTAKVTVKF